MSKKTKKLSSQAYIQPDGSLYLEGNNGGDYIQITPLPDGRIHLEIGHCCVKLVNHIVPVEFLTGVLGSQLVTTRVEILMWLADWPTDFVHSLAKQIEPWKG
jgi:hypothetical protein